MSNTEYYKWVVGYDKLDAENKRLIAQNNKLTEQNEILKKQVMELQGLSEDDLKASDFI